MSSDALARICAQRRDDVARLKRDIRLSDLQARASHAQPPAGFAAALTRKVASSGIALICEIKKASPSAGLIRPDFDPPALARSYQTAGAACLSVLTEPHFFDGSDAYLIAAREATGLPVLRKDFMVDPWQVTEARALGADCILVILAALDDVLAAEIEAAALDLGMDVLLEVHDEAELDRALRLKSPLLGVNNRNLKTLVTDLATTERLAPRIPADRVLVGESGIRTGADVSRLKAAGAQRFLIGEHFMRQPDVTAAVTSLLEDAA